MTELGPRSTLFSYTTLFRSDVIYAAKVWARASDWILADLARRFLERRLFKPVYKVHPTSIPRERLSEAARSEEHTSELQSRENLVCRPVLEKKDVLITATSN